MQAESVKEMGRQTGFDLVGIARAEPTLESLFYPQWLAKGYAGRMDYLKGRRGEMRNEPKTLLSSAKSIICTGLVYNTWPPYSTEVEPGDRGWVSRYAWGEDYHHVVRRMLRRLVERMREEAGPFESKICVDTAPLLERAYAHQAGLGWIGQNTCLINEGIGSWVFLGEVLTSLDLEPDGPAPFRCGTCTRCIEACPTDALVPTGETEGPAYALDSTRCISYWTIELREAIPEASRAEVGAHVFGCDICQDICPWNRRAPETEQVEFQPENLLPNLDEWASLSEGEFKRRFGHTPIERSRYRGFLRNVAVAMGNSGRRKFLPALRAMGRSEDEVVSDHAKWAIRRIEKASAKPVSAGDREGTRGKRQK